MAESSIKFDIGSTFSGEGFKQAQGAVGKLNANVKNAAGAAANLSSALGGLDSSAAKAMGAVTGLMQAFLTLNATTILTQAAMLAVSKYIDSCNKEIEELTRKSEALRASVEKSFQKSLSASVAEVHAEIKGLSGDFDRVTNQAAALAAALSGVKASAAAGGIIDLEIEKVNAMLAAHSEAEKAQIDATYNLKIATAKAAADQEQWNGRIEAARAAVENNSKRVALGDEELAAIERKRAELEEARAGYLQVDTAKAAAVGAEINKLAQEEARIRGEQNALRGKGKTLEAQHQQAIQDAANANKQSQLAITQSTAKIEELKKSAEELAAKEREAAAKQEEENRIRAEATAAREHEKELNEKAKTAQQELNEAKKASAEAERAYAEMLKAYNANYAQNKIDQAILTHDPGKGKLLAPVGVGGDVIADIVQHELAERFKAGDFKSVKAMRDFERARTKELNQQIKRDEWQTMREKQRYEQLKGRSDKSLSKQDREFKKNFEDLLAREAMKRANLDQAKQDAERAKDAERQRAADALKAQEEAVKYTKAIHDQLSRLGLK